MSFNNYYYEYTYSTKYYDKPAEDADKFYFKLIEKGNNTFMFESYDYPGQVIDIAGSREVPGAPLIVDYGHSGHNQMFKGNNVQYASAPPKVDYSPGRDDSY